MLPDATSHPAFSSNVAAPGLGPMAREVANRHGPLAHRDISPVVGGSIQAHDAAQAVLALLRDY